MFCLLGIFGAKAQTEILDSGGDPTGLYYQLSNSTTLTISGNGDMPDMNVNYWPWNSARGTITTIIIQNGVSAIGGESFASCANLTSVTIPESVTSIKGYSFIQCTKLASITIPIGVTAIGQNAFGYCSGLTEITVMNPTTPPTIGVQDGILLSNITVNVPEGLKAAYQADPIWGTFGTIDDGTIDGAISITSRTPAEDADDVAIDAVVSVTFSDDITKVGISGLYIYTPEDMEVPINSVTATGKVLTIEHADFDYGTSYMVIIPVGYIDGYDKEIKWWFTTAADPNPSVTPPTVVADNGGPIYFTEAGKFEVVENLSSAKNIVVSGNWNDTQLSALQASIRNTSNIYNASNTALKKIDFSNAIFDEGDIQTMCKNCTALEEFIFPATEVTKSLNLSNFFNNCTSLTTITNLQNLKSISWLLNTFRNCSKLSEVHLGCTIPEGNAQQDTFKDAKQGIIVYFYESSGIKDENDLPYGWKDFTGVVWVFGEPEPNAPSIAITSPDNNTVVNTNEVKLTFTISNFVIGTDGSVVYNIGGGENYKEVTPQSSGDNYTVTIPGLTEGSNAITLGLLANGDEMPDIADKITIVYSTGSGEPTGPQEILLVTDITNSKELKGLYTDIINQFKNLFGATNNITVKDIADFPFDLSSYDQVWDIRALSEEEGLGGEAIGTAMAEAYVDFLEKGKNLFLMGEYPDYTLRNKALTDVIGLAGGGSDININGETNVLKAKSPFDANISGGEITFAWIGTSLSSGTGEFIATDEVKGRGGAILWDKNTLANAPNGVMIAVFDVNFMQSKEKFGDDDTFDANEQFLKNIFAKMSGKNPGDPEEPNNPGTGEYHTVNIEVAPGIGLYNLSAGNHQVEDGSHLQLQFLPEDGTATADNILFLVDGIETSFKDFGGSNYYSYILSPVNADHTILIAMKEYTVTLPEVEGATFDVGSGDHTVGYGEKFTFTLTLAEGIDPADVHVYANGTEVMPEALRATTLTYIIDKVIGPIVVSIDGAGEPTGNTGIAEGKVSIAVESGQLTVESAGQAVDVAVYTVQGKNVASVRALHGSKTINLQPGIYIVKAGSEVYKVSVY